MLRKALVKIVGEKVEQAVRIELAKDGSGVGGGWNSTSSLLVC
jgi:hexokinase